MHDWTGGAEEDAGHGDPAYKRRIRVLRLPTVRTRVVAIGQGISVLGLEGRGGHRTSKSAAALRRDRGAQG